MISSRTQLITQNSGLQASSSKESAKNQCVINSVQLLIFVLQDMATELSQADLITDFTSDDKIKLIDVTFSQLTFESVSVVLDGASAVLSTAIKSGNDYLGVVYNRNPTALNSSSFL